MPQRISSRFRLRTALGDLATRDGWITAVPATIGWLRLQELHARAAGGGPGCLLAEVVELTPEQAKTIYHNDVGAALGQMVAAPAAGRLTFFASLLDHVQSTGTLRGLESPYLFGLEEAKRSNDTALLGRAENIWQALWSASPDAPVATAVNGALLLDPETNVATILNDDDLTALAPGGTYASLMFGSGREVSAAGSLVSRNASHAAGLFDIDGWRLTMIVIGAIGGAVVGGLVAIALAPEVGAPPVYFMLFGTPVIHTVLTTASWTAAITGIARRAHRSRHRGLPGARHAGGQRQNRLRAPDRNQQHPHHRSRNRLARHRVPRAHRDDRPRRTEHPAVDHHERNR
ncbi:hypothetical protein ACQPW1_44280 [Nocardia sp. CA-128927]|uniref:hypothetical protein n=1 Tax=Nocardia sp. CA-128927 TaxID=3239975 RepID=UPI003D9552A1